MALFEALNITKRYGDHLALDNVSISVPEQSVYGLLGPNGAGKTTLLNLLSGISTPTTGKVEINGDNVLVGFRNFFERFDGFGVSAGVQVFLAYFGQVVVVRPSDGKSDQAQ